MLDVTSNNRGNWHSHRSNLSRAILASCCRGSRLFRQVVLAVLLSVLCSSVAFPVDFKIVWEHDGFCDDGLPGCPVDLFRIYMSPDREALLAGKGELVGTVPGDGKREFEYSLPNDGETRYFAIAAVNSRGVESELSNVIAVVATEMKLDNLLRRESRQKKKDSPRQNP